MAQLCIHLPTILPRSVSMSRMYNKLHTSDSKERNESTIEHGLPAALWGSAPPIYPSLARTHVTDRTLYGETRKPTAGLTSFISQVVLPVAAGIRSTFHLHNRHLSRQIILTPIPGLLVFTPRDENEGPMYRQLLIEFFISPTTTVRTTRASVACMFIDS